MPRSDQPDLFAPDPQQDLFDEDAPERVYRADPDEVRAELLALLTQVRAAQTLPWDRKTAAYYRVVFPQMANWLPDDEAAQLRFDFEAELVRLKAA